MLLAKFQASERLSLKIGQTAPKEQHLKLFLGTYVHRQWHTCMRARMRIHTRTHTRTRSVRKQNSWLFFLRVEQSENRTSRAVYKKPNRMGLDNCDCQVST